MKTIPVVVLMVFFSFIAVSGLDMARGSDLDDGISKFTDDGIEKDDELGKPDINIKFIVMNAKSKAMVKKGDKDKVGSNDGSANMNSVVLGAGSNVKGDIYIIDQSKGPKTNVSD
ncbi:MAG: hypothetical protein V2B20_07055 [Pseudomonadota bacterium]